MDLTINKEENEILDRTEIIGEVSFTGSTPSEAKVREALSEETGSDKKLIVIRSINNEFGKTEASLEARVYNDAEQLEELENIDPEELIESEEEEEDDEGDEDE